MATGFRANGSEPRRRNFFSEQLRGSASVRRVSIGPPERPFNIDSYENTAQHVEAIMGVPQRRLISWAEDGIVKRERHHGLWIYELISVARAIRKFGKRAFGRKR